MWVIYCLFDVMYSTYCLIFPLTLLNICISTVKIRGWNLYVIILKVSILKIILMVLSGGEKNTILVN